MILYTIAYAAGDNSIPGLKGGKKGGISGIFDLLQKIILI